MKNQDEVAIEGLVKSALETFHMKKNFVPGESHIPVTGKVFDNRELENAVRASLEFWLTSGHFSEQFERQLAKTIGVRHALMVNSGSSANLLAVSALTSRKLGERALKTGDEIITVASGFPTTVTPIIQNGLIPVYIDINLGTYVASAETIESAISPKTKAIFMAHTLGNAIELEEIMRIVKKHGLFLIEDSCDALGGTYSGKPLGSFGDMATLSFYPAHHITTGEGGAVLTNRASLKPIIESFRDWGRDCWCQPGCDNTCMKRFETKLGNLPFGYDHKYTYSHLGYNLKSGDIQAAIGLAQLEKLDKFIELRRANWNMLTKLLQDLEDIFILPVPTTNSDPSWFGYALTIREKSKVTRSKILEKLTSKGIGTRLLFGGNLIKQPAFFDTPMRVHGDLKNSDIVMDRTFWIGVWPGLSSQEIEYMSDVLHNIVRE